MEHFERYIECKKAPSEAKMCQIDGVIPWQIRQNPKDKRANSHLPLHCPLYLRASGQLFQVSNCPQLELQDQTKHHRISQSLHNPAGMWLAKFFFFVLASRCVCHQQSEIKIIFYKLKYICKLITTVKLK